MRVIWPRVLSLKGCDQTETGEVRTGIIMSHPASTQIIDLYNRRADDFAQERGQYLIERTWLDRFTARLAPGASILDLGCGSGAPIAAFLIASGYRLTGMDSSAAMIGKCRDRFPEHAWIMADMRALELGHHFDAILAWDSFFHLTPEDQRAMFPVFRAHAKLGTALLFTSGPEHGEAIGSWHGEALYHASLSARESRTHLGRMGFEVTAHTVEDKSCGGHTVWLAQAREPFVPKPAGELNPTVE
jgi:SAM-dependent methyltransferase